MATITRKHGKDGKSLYLARVRLRGHPPESAQFTSIRDARRWAGSIEASIREGRHFPRSEAKRHTVADLVERYRREIGVDPAKLKAGRGHHLERWNAELGPLTLAELTPARIAEVRDKLAREAIDPSKQPKPGCNRAPGRTRSPSTVTRYLATLSHALTVAVREWEWLEENPASKVRRPSAPEGRTGIVTLTGYGVFNPRQPILRRRHSQLSIH